MPFTIEIDDRDFDVENILNALRLPAERQYVAEITVDEPAHGQVTFTGEVVLKRLEGQVLVVAEYAEGAEDIDALPERRFYAADIRRISFY
jgi:hypothetical protein